jgi:hypothetical protein
LPRKEVGFCASIFTSLVECSVALSVHLPYPIFSKLNENAENKGNISFTHVSTAFIAPITMKLATSQQHSV